MSDWKMNFCNKFAIKTFCATVANANIGSLKSLPSLFDICLGHMMVKFEQNWLIRDIQNFELFERKPVF